MPISSSARRLTTLLALLAVVLGSVLFVAPQRALAASTITQWTFEGDVTTPATGSGTASLVGGTTASFATGNPSGRGWNTTSYPAASTGNKTAGAQFAVSTVGFENIMFSFDIRHSNTAANTIIVQYSTDGGTSFTDAQTFTFTPAETGTGDTWYSRSVDLSAITALDNISGAIFRVVSAFDPEAGTYLASRSTSSYATTGTMRYDNVTVAGDSLTTGSTTTRISAIQGSGAAVTGAGPFTVEAIVVGDFQGQGGTELQGFFVQEEDADSDGNVATSEGIFVFCQTCPVNVSVGDLVRVTGTASEFFNMSQLTATTADSVTVLSSGNPLPTPATVTLPVPGVTATDLTGARAQINAYFEQFEGMLVRFNTQLAIAEYFELARYGQIILSSGGRPRQFTDQNAPSVAGFTQHQIDLARRTIILDDRNNTQNFAITGSDTPYFWPRPGLSVTNRFRGGDTITNLTGVLHWSFAGQTGTDAWRIRPVEPAFSYTFTNANPRPAAPTVAGDLKVGAYNVLNYFLTIDDTASSSTGPCGANRNLDCRGPDSAAERDRQQAKLTQALLGLNADVLGLIELENTPGVTPTLKIVNDLNAVAGAGTYAFIDTGVLGTDAIRLGILYKPGRVTPVGTPLVDNAAVHDRPPLAQQFQTPSGARFTVIVNHFKSKSCTDASGANLDQNDGQGCFNADRIAQSQALLAFINTTVLPTTGDPDVLIIGDLNSYRNENPITTLEAAGYVDLIDTRLGANAYSYLFSAQLGYLDYVLASASLAPQVAGVTEWHINADESDLLDYNDATRDTGESSFERRSAAQPLYAADAFRTSDHDPVLVGMNLAAPQRLVYLPIIAQ